MYYRESYGVSLMQITIIIFAISIFLTVKAVLFVVRTFVKYPKKIALWLALAISIVLSIVGVLLRVLTQSDGYLSLAYAGASVLLLTCFVVDLKNSDTLMAEKPSLVDQILHQSWWASEDTPLELENDQLAA